MKKTFALVLAVAMVMSLAAVSFAAEGLDLVNNDPLRYYGDEAYDSGYAVAGKKEMRSDDTFAYGDTVYFALTDGSNPLTEYESVEKLKIKAKWEMGSDLVESVSVVKKNVEGKYQYYVAVKVAAKQTTADADIVGTLTLNRRASSSDGLETIKDLERDISFNVFYRGNTWQGHVDFDVDGDVSLKYDTNYALKFSADDEVELSFGDKNSALNEGTFTVDVSGQGKLFFRFDTKANEDIVAANPGAKVKFVNFNNVSFNRTGEFAYEWEDGAYVYQIVDGQLKAIPGAEYDEADETFYFYTRTLGSYVFSDVELVNPAVEAPVVEAPSEVENPTTGAAA